MDEQRALLDQLMGVNRNLDRAKEEIKDYRDKRVCKFFLLGVCPHDMFVNTKMDDGPCSLIHSEEMKEKFEKDGDVEMYDDLIERDFSNRCADIDRTIRRCRARVEEDNKADELNVETNPEILQLQSDMQKLTNEAEIAGEQGNIDECMDLMQKVELMLKERDTILQRFSDQKRVLRERAGVDVNKKLRVCDVCGSFLSILDSDKRLADHFLGKQHLGYQVMRDTVDAIKKRRDARRAGQSSTHPSGGGGDNTAGGSASGGDGLTKRDRSRERDDNRDGGGDRGNGSNDYRGGDRGGDRDDWRGGDRRRDSSRDRGDNRDWDRGGGGGGGRRDYYGGDGRRRDSSRERDRGRYR